MKVYVLRISDSPHGTLGLSVCATLKGAEIESEQMIKRAVACYGDNKQPLDFRRQEDGFTVSRAGFYLRAEAQDLLP